MIMSIRNYREIRRLTLEQFAKKFGVHKTTVMRWEAGNVPAERVLEIEHVIGVSRHKLRPDLYPKPVEGGASKTRAS